MKLIKEFLARDDVTPPPNELIMESDDLSQLKRTAECRAREDYNVVEYMWEEASTPGVDYRALTIDDQCRYVIRA